MLQEEILVAGREREGSIEMYIVGSRVLIKGTRISGKSEAQAVCCLWE